MKYIVVRKIAWQLRVVNYETVAFMNVEMNFKFEQKERICFSFYFYSLYTEVEQVI